jgi:Flp pilus assembly protein TadG
MKRFLRAAKRGVAAVEFALILPIMVTMYLGSVEITELLLANRRLENVAASAADILARDTMITETELTDVSTAMQLLMEPNPASGLKVRLSAITITNNGTTATVTWSRSYWSYPTLNAGSTVTDLPTDLMNANNPSIIRAEVIYDYDSPLNWMLPGTFRLSHTEYRRPRLVDPPPLCVSNCS